MTELHLAGFLIILTSHLQQSIQRPPQACKGLFRCLSCKNGKGVRLPAARLLNHLRYFHSPELIEVTEVIQNCCFSLCFITIK